MSTTAQHLPAQPSATVASAAPPAKPARADDVRLGSLARWLDPVSPTLPVLAVGERFLDAASAPWLSLPVVESDKPVGSVSRSNSVK